MLSGYLGIYLTIPCIIRSCTVVCALSIKPGESRGEYIPDSLCDCHGICLFVLEKLDLQSVVINSKNLMWNRRFEHDIEQELIYTSIIGGPSSETCFDF